MHISYSHVNRGRKIHPGLYIDSRAPLIGYDIMRRIKLWPVKSLARPSIFNP